MSVTKRMSKCKGLSFAELSVSILILAILASVALPAVEVSSRRIKEWELKGALRDIREAIDRYYDVHAKYPKTLETLTEKDQQGKRYLRNIPIDPITDKREWFTVSSTDDTDDFIRLFSDNSDVYDVKSKSELESLEGDKYNEW